MVKASEHLMESQVAKTDEELCGEACQHGHVLRVEGLGVSYGKVRALSEVGFETHCGHRVALLGANGAGKTTLLKALAGLVPFEQGVLSWRGELLQHGSAEIAYVPQRSQVDWNFPGTVRRIVEMGRFPHLGWWKAFGKKDQLAVDEALEVMQLQDLQNRQIRALSGGQQQRVFLARALAQQAHVFLLDEPFAGLDASSSDHLGEMFAKLAEKDHLIIASHHDLIRVPDWFDEVLVLGRKNASSEAGRVLAFGKVEEVFDERWVREVIAGQSGEREVGA